MIRPAGLAVVLAVTACRGNAPAPSAAQLTEQECLKGSVEDCKKLAGTVEATEKRCEAGELAGCSLATRIVHAMGRPALTTNPFRGLHLMKRSCDLGDAELCLGLASGISVMRKRAAADGQVGTVTLELMADAGIHTGPDDLQAALTRACTLRAQRDCDAGVPVEFAP